MILSLHTNGHTISGNVRRKSIAYTFKVTKPFELQQEVEKFKASIGKLPDHYVIYATVRSPKFVSELIKVKTLQC